MLNRLEEKGFTKLFGTDFIDIHDSGNINYKKNDIYWCSADIGWVTGHSYIIYGPLSNGATTIMFEGVPNFPDTSRFWQVVDKHKVNIFYTAPTALRALMKEGDDHVISRNLSSLKLLGTVGEPIKEPEWNWYYEMVGKSHWCCRNHPLRTSQSVTGTAPAVPWPLNRKNEDGCTPQPYPMKRIRPLR